MAITPETSTRATKDEAAELPRCQCGCGQIRTPKRQFVMGHDAKLKSRLLAQWDAGLDADAEELVERGWYSWDELEARREKIEAKAEAKAQREADRKAKAEANRQAKAAAKIEPTLEPAARKPPVSRGRKASTTTSPAA